MAGLFNFDNLKGKTLKQAEFLIEGFSYELQVNDENTAVTTTNGANKAILIALDDEGKITSYKIK